MFINLEFQIVLTVNTY